MESFYSILNKINEVILNPLIVLMFAVALVYFFWGIVQFIWGMDNSGAKEKGKQNMIWGIVGFFIMIGVYGIIRIILNTFGLNSPGLEYLFF